MAALKPHAVQKVAAQKDSDRTRLDAESRISSILRARVGHDFSKYKEKTMVRRASGGSSCHSLRCSRHIRHSKGREPEPAITSVSG
jgi:hypothetical protein